MTHLHVSGTGHKLLLEDVLDNTHKQLYQKFNLNNSSNIDRTASSNDALILEKFLRDIKSYNVDKKANLTLLDRATYDAILNQMPRGSLSQLFMHSGGPQYQGAIFEQELAQIVEATLAEASGTTFNTAHVDAMIIGAKKVNANEHTIDAHGIVKETGRYIIKTVSTIGNKKIIGDKNTTASKNIATYAISHGTAKIDGTGLTCKWSLSATCTNEFRTVASLLTKATYSAKSYQDVVLDIQNKLQIRNITIGKSAVQRSIKTILNAFYSSKIAISAYCAMKSTAKTDINKINWYAKKFILIYELTGYGQNFIDTTISNALGGSNYVKYLILNDPKYPDRIYVKSTQELLYNILNNIVGNSHTFGKYGESQITFAL